MVLLEHWKFAAVVDDVRIHLRPPVSQSFVERAAAVETMSTGLLGIASRMLFDRLACIVQVMALRCHTMAGPDVACMLVQHAVDCDGTAIVAGGPVVAVDDIAVASDSMVAGVHIAAVAGQGYVVAADCIEVEAQQIALVGQEDGTFAAHVVQAVDKPAAAEGFAVDVNSTALMAHNSLLVVQSSAVVG